MRNAKASLTLYSLGFLVALFGLVGSVIIPASRLAYAHTFSISESAQFLSLVDQIRGETWLVTSNLENNNATLAQAHAEHASSLLDNSTIREIRERNTRIAVALDDGLRQLKENVTALALASQGQVPQDKITAINQAVTSLNDSLSEAVSVRIEPDQQSNATTWAMALSDLVNVVLSDYGNATGAPFDLTNMTNMAGMQGLQMNQTSNTTMAMTANANSSIGNNMTTTIVDQAAYQSAQYLANKSLLKLFNDNLKPLTTTTNNNMTSSLNDLQTYLLQLRDNINNKASPNEVMMTAHTGILPLLMKIYDLTTVQQEGQDNA